MNRADAHPPRPRCWPCHALFLLLPACFHTELLPEDAGVGHDDAAAMVDQDAAGPPSDAFNPANDCPASYDLTLPGQMTRYRLIKTGARAWEHSDACNNDSSADSSGVTHLTVVNTTAEVMRIEELVNKQTMGTIAGDAVLIGGVQLNTATKPGDSWFGFDGRSLINTPWYDDANDHEPNDSDATENGQEQFIVIAAGKDGLNDGDGASLTKLHGALCECDGHPIAPKASTAVDSYRMP